MSYTPLTDLNDELESLNAEQDGQTIIQDRMVEMLANLIELQTETNKLLKKIYNHE